MAVERRILHARALAVSPKDGAIWIAVESVDQTIKPPRAAWSLRRFDESGNPGVVVDVSAVAGPGPIFIRPEGVSVDEMGLVLVSADRNGQSELYRFSPDGQLLPQVVRVPESLFALRAAPWGGGVALAGMLGPVAAYLARFDGAGKLLWEHRPPPASPDPHFISVTRPVVPLSEDSAVFATSTIDQRQQPNAQRDGIVLTALDRAGKERHRAVIGGRLLAARRMEDSGVLVVRRIPESSSWNTSVERLTPDLKQQWATRIPLRADPNAPAMVAEFHGRVVTAMQDASERLVFATVSAQGKMEALDHAMQFRAQPEGYATVRDGFVVAGVAFVPYNEGGRVRNAGRLVVARFRVSE